MVISGTTSPTITQCTVAQLTAAANRPVVDISSTGTITIISLDTVGGTIGWRVGTDGHDLKSVLAIDASQYSNALDGVHVFGTGNKLKSNSANTNVGAEFDIGPGNVNQGGNKANNRACTVGTGGGRYN